MAGALPVDGPTPPDLSSLFSGAPTRPAPRGQAQAIPSPDVPEFAPRSSEGTAPVGPPDLSSLFAGPGELSQVKTAAPDRAELTDAIRPLFTPGVFDPGAAIPEFTTGVRRGFHSGVGAVARLLGATETAAAQFRRASELEPEIGSFRDIRSPADAERWVFGLLGTSAPEMLAVGSTVAAGTAAGGPVAGLLSGWAVASAFHTGRNAQVQEAAGEKDVNWARAAFTGLLAGGLDTVIPGHLGRQVGGRFTDVVDGAVSSSLGREIGEDALVESATEVIQEFLESAQARPGDFARILDPQTDADVQYAQEVLSDMIEGAIGGMAAGGTLSGVVNAGYYGRLEERESSGNPEAEAEGSSATGLHQFTDATWLSTVRKHRPDLMTGRSESEVLALRADPGLSRELVQYFTEDNAAFLSGAGLPVTQASLYAAHHFGPEGARKLFTALPDDPVQAVLGPDVVRANPYLRGKSVAEAIQNIQADFGDSGIDLTPARPTYADIQTREDRSGDRLASVEPVQQKNALREVFEQEFLREVGQAFPRISDRLLDARLMSPASNATPLQNMVRVAEGTFLLDGVALSDSKAVALETLRRFGYGPDVVTGSTDFNAIPPPKFNTRPINQRAASLGRVVAKQFLPTESTSFARSPYTPEVLPRILDIAAVVANRMTGKADHDYKAGKAGATRLHHNAAIRRASAAIREMSEALRALNRGTPPQNHEQIIMRGLHALGRVDKPLADHFEQVLRTYYAATEPGAEFAPVARHMRRMRERAGVMANRPEYQFDYSAPRTKRGAVRKSRIQSPANSSALVRAHVLADERYRTAIRTEQKSQTVTRQDRAEVLQEESRERRQKLRKVQVEAELKAYTAALDQRAGTPGRAGTNVAEHLTPPTIDGRIGKALLRGTPQTAMLFFMSMRQIATSYNQFLPRIRVGRTVRNMVDAYRLALQAGDTEGKAVITTGAALGERLSNLGAERMQALGSVMNDATRNGITLFQTDGTSFFVDESDFADSLTESGTNAGVPAGRHAEAERIFSAFQNLDSEQQGLYREARDWYQFSNRRLLDTLVRNVADELLGPKSGIRTAKDAHDALDTGKVVGDAATALRALFRRARVPGDYFLLDRDEGNWSVYAEETTEFRAPTRQAAKAKLDAARERDPAMQPEGGAITYHEEGSEVVVRGKRTFYKIFTSEKRAQNATQKLRSGTVDGFSPQVVTDAQMRSRQLYQHGLPVNTLKELRAVATRNDEPAVMDAINTLLARQNSSLVSIKRDNDLGASENIAEIMRSHAVRTGLQVRQLHSEPELARIEADTRQTMEDWSGKPENRERLIQTRKILNHLEQYKAQRRALFDDSAWRTLNRRASMSAVVWYLSSISYYALNMVQPVVYGSPIMAGRYGRTGVASLVAHNARLAHMLYKGARTAVAKDTQAIHARIAHFKDVDLRDPKDPMTSLRGAETTTYDPKTGEPVYLNNTQFEYDEYARGDITLDHLLLLSETRKQGAFGSTFHDAPIEFTHTPDTQPEGFRETTGSVVSKGMDIAALVGRVSAMAEHIEYINRRAVVDTVISMELRKGGEQTLRADRIAEIAAVADELTYQINVDYSASNRSLAHQKAGVVLLFSSFGFHFAYMTWRSFRALVANDAAEFGRGQAAGVFFGLLGTHLLTSGITAAMPQWLFAPGMLSEVFGGLTGVDPVSELQAGVVAWLYDMFGDEEDDPEEIYRQVDTYGLWNFAKAFVREQAGDSVADVVFEGVPATMLNLDLSGRISLRELYTFVDVGSLTEGEDQLKDVAFGLLGPVPAVGANIMRSKEKMQQQGVSMSAIIETLFPLKIGRDAARAYRYSQDGLQDRAGSVILTPEQFDTMDLLIQSTGFPPDEVADVYRLKTLDFAAKTPIQKERDMIFTRFRLAASPAERNEANRMRREFNRRYPDFAITEQGLRTSLKSNREKERDFARTGGIRSDNRQIAADIDAIEGDRRE